MSIGSFTFTDFEATYNDKENAAGLTTNCGDERDDRAIRGRASSSLRNTSHATTTQSNAKNAARNCEKKKFPSHLMTRREFLCVSFGALKALGLSKNGSIVQ